MDNTQTKFKNYFVYSSPRNIVSNLEETGMIGHYKIMKPVGNGAFGEVCIARHVIFRVIVAIKILNKSKIDAKSHPKVIREIRLLKRLCHPHIVKLYEVMETDTEIYLVMENCEGGELFTHLIGGRCSERKARKLIRPIISALKYCHSNNVVHRDLKAENILLTNKGEIKLVDFGFGNDFRIGSRLETFCGSPPYAAPELFSGKFYEGPEVDIWALGVLLYCITTNMFPFEGENISTLRQNVIKGKYKLPYHISRQLGDLITHMLEVSMQKRYTIREVSEHKWVNTDMQDEPIESLRNYNPFEEKRLDVIEMMEKMGYRKADILNSIEALEYDSIMATYLILGDIKDGNLSADIDSSCSIKGLVEWIDRKVPHSGSFEGHMMDANSEGFFDASDFEEVDNKSVEGLLENNVSYTYGKPGLIDVPTRDRAATQMGNHKKEEIRNRSNTVESARPRALSKWLNNMTIFKKKKQEENSKHATSGYASGGSSKFSVGELAERKKLKKTFFYHNVKAKTSRKLKEFWPDLIAVLDDNKCSYKEEKPYRLLCVTPLSPNVENITSLTWRLKIVRLPKDQLGIIYSRVTGSSYHYKNYINHIMDSLAL